MKYLLLSFSFHLGLILFFWANFTFEAPMQVRPHTPSPSSVRWTVELREKPNNEKSPSGLRPSPSNKTAVSKDVSKKVLKKTVEKNSKTKAPSTNIKKLGQIKKKKHGEPDLEKSATVSLLKERQKMHQASGIGTPSNSTRQQKASYTEELKSFLEKNKNYPRQALLMKQSGTVEVAIRIDAQGNFSKIRLVKGSAFPVLNQATLDLFHILKRFKPLPKSIGDSSDFQIPVSYQMGRL